MDIDHKNLEKHLPPEGISQENLPEIQVFVWQTSQQEHAKMMHIPRPYCEAITHESIFLSKVGGGKKFAWSSFASQEVFTFAIRRLRYFRKLSPLPNFSGRIRCCLLLIETNDATFVALTSLVCIRREGGTLHLHFIQRLKPLAIESSKQTTIKPSFLMTNERLQSRLNDR